MAVRSGGIDRFAAAEVADIERQVLAVRNRLGTNANAIIAVRRQLDGLTDEVGELSLVQSKIKALAKAQGDEKTDEVNVAHTNRALRGREQKAVEESRELIGKYGGWLNDSIGRFTQQAQGPFDDEILSGPNGELMVGVQEGLKRLGAQLDALLEQAARIAARGGQEIAELASKLEHVHQQQELAFRDLMAKHNRARGVATERAELEKKRNDLLAKERRKAELQGQLDGLNRERSELGEGLRALWKHRFELRQQVADWINKGATSPIRVRIDQHGDPSGYRNQLASWLKGTVVQYNVAAKKLAAYVPPADLLKMVSEGRADALQVQANLGDGQTAKVMEALGRIEVLLQLDTVEQADLPRIELLDGEEWKNSLHLSTGQKCTTILPILLLDSDNPLLVDQPEDNLDNRYIYDTVVNAIHRVKAHRQIILITHNPNIPVLGEASAVYVLTSDGERSSLANQGSVDDCKTEIINLLEGGQEAFDRRKERYSY